MIVSDSDGLSAVSREGLRWQMGRSPEGKELREKQAGPSEDVLGHPGKEGRLGDHPQGLAIRMRDESPVLRGGGLTT